MNKKQLIRSEFEILVKGGCSKHGAIEILADRHNVEYETCSRYLRKDAKKKKKETIVGIIGDTHLPYELDGYMDWCKSVFDAEGVNKLFILVTCLIITH